MERLDRDEMFIMMAQVAAQRGTCDRAKVGAILVHDNRVVSMGYNGSPKGQSHCDDVGHKIVDGHCIRTTHAEVNCLNFAKGLHMLTKLSDCTLYCTHYPCMECTLYLVRESLKVDGIHIVRVVYLEPYRIKEAPEVREKLFEAGGIRVEQHTGRRLEGHLVQYPE